VRRAILVLVAALASVPVMSAAALAAGPSDFEGTWAAVDNDGSDMVMTLHSTGHGVRMNLFDDGASGCGEPLGGATAKGFGSIDGDVLSVAYRIKCDNGSRFTGLTIRFEYVSSGVIRELRTPPLGPDITWTLVP
jgi:hypothetical protein